MIREFENAFICSVFRSKIVSQKGWSDCLYNLLHCMFMNLKLLWMIISVLRFGRAFAT